MAPLDAGSASVDVEPDLKDFGLKMSAGVNAALNQVQKGIGPKLTQLGSQMKQAGSTMTKGITLPIVAIGGLAFKAAVDFETAFAGVRKTVQGTEAQFAALEKGLRGMAKATGTSAKDLSAIAEAAGALGIKTDDILEFVDVVNKLDVATDLTAESAATALGKLANVLSIPTKEFENFAGALVQLGNTGASTESEIVEMALRIAGTGKTIGLATSDILGFAAAAADAGIAAERGGTSLSKTFQDLARAVATGGEELDLFAKTAGTSASNFAKAFDTDAAGATAAFIEGLRKVRKEAGAGGVLRVLDELGIKETRQVDTLQLLAQAQTDLSDKIRDSASAYKEASAANAEFEKKQQTTERLLARLKQGLVDTFITLGERLIPVLEKNLPTIEKIGDAIAGLVESFGRLDPGLQEKIVKGFLIFALAGPLLSGLGAFIGLFGNLANIVRTFQGARVATAIAGIGTSAAGAAPAVGGLAGALAKVGAGTGAAAAGTASLYGLGAALSALAAVKLDQLNQNLHKSGSNWKFLGEALQFVHGSINPVARGLQIFRALTGSADDKVKELGVDLSSAAIKASVLGNTKMASLINEIERVGNQAGISDGQAEALLDVVQRVGTSDMAALETSLRAVAAQAGLDTSQVNALLEAIRALDVDREFTTKHNIVTHHLTLHEQRKFSPPGFASSEGAGPSTHQTPHMGGIIRHAGGIIPSLHSSGLRHNERLVKALAGEFVLRTHATRVIGADNLAAMNARPEDFVNRSSGDESRDIVLNINGREFARATVRANDVAHRELVRSRR